MLVPFFSEKSNAIYDEPMEYQGYKFTVGWLIVVFSLLTGVHYNTENMVRAFIQAEDKVYALACCLPYAQFFAMLFCSSYSQLFKDYVFLFVCLNGLFLTYVTGNFNLNTTASMKFNYLYVDPWIFGSILYVDHNKLADLSVIKLLYVVFTAQLAIKYLAFMYSVIV